MIRRPARGLCAGAVWVAGCALAAQACGGVAPPPSAMPDARTAVARLDATFAGVSGLSGRAKIDYLGARGRVRGEASLLVSAPASLRLAITADVIGGAGEIASDGVRFEADDRAHGRFMVGAAKPCSMARLTRVPLAS